MIFRCENVVVCVMLPFVPVRKPPRVVVVCENADVHEATIAEPTNPMKTARKNLFMVALQQYLNVVSLIVENVIPEVVKQIGIPWSRSRRTGTSSDRL